MSLPPRTEWVRISGECLAKLSSGQTGFGLCLEKLRVRMALLSCWRGPRSPLIVFARSMDSWGWPFCTHDVEGRTGLQPHWRPKPATTDAQVRT